MGSTAVLSYEPVDGRLRLRFRRWVDRSICSAWQSGSVNIPAPLARDTSTLLGAVSR